MKCKKLFSFVLIFVWIFAASASLTAQKRKLTGKNRVVNAPPIEQIKTVQKIAPELQRRVDTFNLVWQTVKDNYFDQTFSGLDWNKIRSEFEPRVLQTATDKQLHEILDEMINRLNRSHFAIIPPEVYREIERAKSEAKAREKQSKATGGNQTGDADEEKFDVDAAFSTKFGIGVELRLINDKFVITRVEKNSAAETAGLKTGFEIDKINDVSLNMLLFKLELYGSKIRNVKRYLPAQIVQYMLNGEKDGFVRLTCLDALEQPKEFRVRREPLKGATISIGKNYPEQFLQFETASLNEDVGYIKFNLFALPVVEKFCAALTELKNKKAIIVDLRGNEGGILGILIGLGGMLTDKTIDLGTSIYKVGRENMIAASKAKNYSGKIVLLVDNETVSAAEIFAAALQENRRAFVVGDKTAGEALPSVSVALPTGAVLLYPIANFKTRDGNLIEGKGVEPNFAVSLDRKSLLEGRDNQLETALQIIKENRTFPKANEEAIAIKALNPPPPPPMPPPAALKSAPPKGKVLGEVNIKTGSATRVENEANKIDEKATQIISAFVSKIGGEGNLKKIDSYILQGSSEINFRGTKTDLEINIIRRKDDAYAELMKSVSIGEVREVYNGAKVFVQTDYGLDIDLPSQISAAKMEILAPILDLTNKDSFQSLKYQGVFERLGRKTQIIAAKTADGANVALAFDVETKMLVSYATAFGTISFGDYRLIENVSLPFHIERERLMTIDIEDIKLNPPIEDDVFAKKEKCFDKAN